MPEDGGQPLPPLDEELVNATLAELFPNGVPSGRGRAPMGASNSPIIEVYPLDVEHMKALAEHIDSGASMGKRISPLKSIRHTHHRVAQLLALGVDETEVALVCNMNKAYVSVLKSDPMFREVLNYYAGQVTEAWTDTVEVMKRANLDMLGELTDRLFEDPKAFTPTQLIEAIKVLSDRSGHGPTSNVNTRNTHVTLTPEDLRRIKDGVYDGGRTRAPDGNPRTLPEESVRALQRVALPAPRVDDIVREDSPVQLGLQFPLPDEPGGEREDGGTEV